MKYFLIFLILLFSVPVFAAESTVGGGPFPGVTSDGASGLAVDGAVTMGIPNSTEGTEVTGKEMMIENSTPADAVGYKHTLTLDDETAATEDTSAREYVLINGVLTEVVKHDANGTTFPRAVTMYSSSQAIPATGILTAAMHKGGVTLNDSLLSAATDVQLLAVSAEFDMKYYTRVGTHGTSWKPPAGEALVMISTPLTADYEMDLSHAIYDEFTISRRVVGAGYRYIITPVKGSVADGGAS